MWISGSSAKGTRREVSEDRVLFEASVGLAAVIDGTGGLVTGSLAAALARGELHRGLATRGSPAERVTRAFAAADRAIAEAVASEGRSVQERAEAWEALLPAERAIVEGARRGGLTLHGMVATAALVLAHDGRVLIAHVGDCRVYRVRHGTVELLTADHVLAVPRGFRPLLRALGSAGAAPDLREEALFPGDVLVLCTDGVWPWVDWAGLPAMPPAQVPDTLLARAAALGDGDDGAVAVVAAT